MKKLALVLLTSSVLAGCGTTSQEPQKEATDDMLAYNCGGQTLSVAINASGDEARVWVGNDMRILRQSVSASGAKYSDDTYTFWSKGDQATLYKGDTVILGDCRLMR